MQRYETVTTEQLAEKVRLQGVVIEPRVVNKTLHALEFSDSMGNKFVIEKEGYGELRVLRPSLPKRKVYRVTATFADKLLGNYVKECATSSEAIDTTVALKQLGCPDADWNEFEQEVQQ